MEITVTKSVIWNGDNHLSKNIYSTFLYQVPDPDDETAVEYTRTDTFIEKAYEYLNKTCRGFILTEKDIEDFKNYMKGE